MSLLENNPQFESNFTMLNNFEVAQEDVTEASTDVISVLNKNQNVKAKKGALRIEIPDLDIKAPIQEGITQDVLEISAGHFENTGALGEGNYCLAGHSSDTYACIFNNLKDVKLGMPMHIIDKEGTTYTYYVTDNFVVEPEEIWVLNPTLSSQLTLVTCTDGGHRRQVVTGLMMTEDEYKDYVKRIATERREHIQNYTNCISDISISEYLKGVS